MTAMSELYVNQTFVVYVIRCGIQFWTGRRFESAPYTAKLYGSEQDAQATIGRLRLSSATVRRMTLHHH